MSHHITIRVKHHDELDLARLAAALVALVEIQAKDDVEDGDSKDPEPEPTGD